MALAWHLAKRLVKEGVAGILVPSYARSGEERAKVTAKQIIAAAKDEALSTDMLRAEAGEDSHLFAGLIIGMRWTRRKLRNLFETRYKTRLEEVE